MLSWYFGKVLNIIINGHYYLKPLNLFKNEKSLIHHRCDPDNHLGDIFFSLPRYRWTYSYSFSNCCNRHYPWSNPEGVNSNNVYLFILL